jgi:hypothetical protein
MHLRDILSFSSFLENVSINDITIMLQELLENTKSSVYNEVFDGIVKHIFNDFSTRSVTGSASTSSDAYHQKCLHILHQICFPMHTAMYTSADHASAEPCHNSLQNSNNVRNQPFLQVLLRTRDLCRLRRISVLLASCHDTAQVEDWQVLLLRSLFFCHIVLDEGDNNPSDSDSNNGNNGNDDSRDGLLGPMNRLMETFSPGVVRQALNSALQVQVQEQVQEERQLHCAARRSPTPLPAQLLLLQVEACCPLDREGGLLAAPPSGLIASLLRLLLAPPGPSCTPLLPRSLVLQSATSIAVLGISEQQTVFFLRGVKLVALTGAGAGAGAGAAAGSHGLLGEWLRGLILGVKNSALSCSPPPSSAGRGWGEERGAALSTKEFQFLCLTLCSSVASQSESVLRQLCSVLRAPAVRALDPDHEAVDMFLQLSRARLRDLQEVALQLKGGERGAARTSSLLQALTRGGRSGQSSSSSSSSNGGGPKSAAIPEVTVARIQSWAATFRRTGELPVSVSQLCHLLAQGSSSSSSSGRQRDNNNKSNIVLRSGSYRLLLDCMEHMIREELLTVSTSSATSAKASTSKAGSGSGVGALLPLPAASQAVALGMSKCSPPLCPPEDAAAFSSLVEQITSGDSGETAGTGSGGSSGSGSRGAGAGAGPRSSKEAVFAGVSHVLPAASQASPQQWQDRVTACRKAVEAALLIPSSVRQLIAGLDDIQQQRSAADDADSETGGSSFSFAGLNQPAEGRDGVALSSPLSVPVTGASGHSNSGDAWLSESFSAGMCERWLAACRDAVLCCSSVHADVLRRFTGTITLFVLQTCHMIYNKIIEMYAVVKSLYTNEKQMSLAPTFAAIVPSLFKLSTILERIFSASSSSMLDMAVSIIEHGWRRKRVLTADGSGGGEEEEGANALFLCCLNGEVRTMLLASRIYARLFDVFIYLTCHLMLCYVISSCYVMSSHVMSYHTCCMCVTLCIT